MPVNAAWDDNYRRIEVKIARKGARVLYRHGYYASESLPASGRKDFLTYTRIAAAGAITQSVTELAVSATAQYTKSSQEVQLTVTVKVDGLKFTGEDGRHHASLQLTTFCGNASQAIVGQTWQTVDLNLGDDTYQRMLAQGLTYTQRVPVHGDPKYAKVIAYDYAGDRTGTALVVIR